MVLVGLVGVRAMGHHWFRKIVPPMVGFRSRTLPWPPWPPWPWRNQHWIDSYCNWLGNLTDNWHSWNVNHHCSQACADDRVQTHQTPHSGLYRFKLTPTDVKWQIDFDSQLGSETSDRDKIRSMFTDQSISQSTNQPINQWESPFISSVNHNVYHRTKWQFSIYV